MPKADIRGLPDPLDALMLRAVPSIMAAIAGFDNPFEALRMLMVVIARKCNVTNSYAFLSSPGVADNDDMVISKIGACLQYGCTSYEDAETVFNEGLTEVNAATAGTTTIPASTPSPVPHPPHQSSPMMFDPNAESLDELVDKRVAKAFERRTAEMGSPIPAQAPGPPSHPLPHGATPL